MSPAPTTPAAVCTVEDMVPPHTRSGTHKPGFVLAAAFLLTATACTSSQSDVSYPDTTATAATNTTTPRSAAPAASVVQTTTTRPAEPRSTITLFAQGDIIPVPPNPPSGLKRPVLSDELEVLETEIAVAYEEIAWAIRQNAVEPAGPLPTFLDKRLIEPFRSAYLRNIEGRDGTERREPDRLEYAELGDYFKVQVSTLLYEFGIAEVTVCSFREQIRADVYPTDQRLPAADLTGWRLGLTEDGEWGLVALLWYEESVQIEGGESCWDERPFVPSAPVY